MPKIKIRHVYPDGSYRETKGKVKPESPNNLFTRVGSSSQAIHIAQRNVISPMGKSERYETWEEFVNSEPPLVDIRSSKRLAVLPANGQFPISTEDPFDTFTRIAHGQVVAEEIKQMASTQATRESSGVDTTKKVMIILAVAVLLLCVMLAFPLVKTLGMFGVGDSITDTASQLGGLVTDANGDAVQQPIREIAPGECVAYVPALDDFAPVQCPGGG